MDQGRKRAKRSLSLERGLKLHAPTSAVVESLRKELDDERWLNEKLQNKLSLKEEEVLQLFHRCSRLESASIEVARENERIKNELFSKEQETILLQRRCSNLKDVNNKVYSDNESFKKEIFSKEQEILQLRQFCLCLEEARSKESHTFENELQSKEQEGVLLLQKCSNMGDTRRNASNDDESLKNIIESQNRELAESKEKSQQLIKREAALRLELEEIRKAKEILESNNISLCETMESMEETLKKALDDVEESDKQTESYRLSNVKQRALAKQISDKHEEKLCEIIDDLRAIYRTRRPHACPRFWRQRRYDGKVESRPIGKLIDHLTYYQLNNNLLNLCKVQVGVV